MAAILSKSYWDWAEKVGDDGWKLLVVAIKDDHDKPVVFGNIDDFENVLVDLLSGNLYDGVDYVLEDGLPQEVGHSLYFWVGIFTFCFQKLLEDDFEEFGDSRNCEIPEV